MSSLGTRLQRFRLENGWSTRVVARRLGVSAPSVVRWEHGAVVPNGDNRTKIERLLADGARPSGRPPAHPRIIELPLFAHPTRGRTRESR
ncbi:MAG: helix-turn-helix transcriptional regulator [Candidatus Bipolaricaulota bacterium]|nr:MAG: helix-turn-helix transcriptional regulator [Candidatus Bipolaricaulota bacterium]